nr:hypothetical protein [uncultured bacterium]
MSISRERIMATIHEVRRALQASDRGSQSLENLRYRPHDGPLSRIGPDNEYYTDRREHLLPFCS